jgi:hypothetical protein
MFCFFVFFFMGRTAYEFLGVCGVWVCAFPVWCGRSCLGFASPFMKTDMFYAEN